MIGRVNVCIPLILLAGIFAVITPSVTAAEDRDAMPVKRVPPQMPDAAMHSGYCNLSFDLTVGGDPENIKIIMCTDDLFEQSSIEAVGKWKYAPKIQGGKPVTRAAIETRMTFRLANENGDLIPETEAVETRNLPYDGEQKQAKIIYQLPPYNGRPKTGEASEFCCMIFSVSQIGTPFNVIAENCSNENFPLGANSLIRAWQYEPVKKNGIPVSSDDYARVIFFVKRKWTMLRDVNGYTPIPGTPEDYTRMCRIMS